MLSFRSGGDNGLTEFVALGGTEISPPTDGTLAPPGFRFEIYSKC